eukprot:Phypoly_transcript_14863.p1 GENE.Phypoly_transcript_14863~~Phypoly_transcript_14863.p1  ORF type:complete len:129 (+),score=32.15 Phypoly_transcript_14863:496-882(+)
MGNSIATAIAEKQKGIQKGIQEEMQKAQMRNMERQRKVMMATQQAFIRESLNWSLPTYFTLLGIASGLVAKNKAPRFVIAPFIPIGVFFAYQYDFAYGNKIARVNATAEKILAEQYNITMPKEEPPHP